MDEGYLAFSVAGETFALSLFQVEEILEPMSPIAVPEAPHFVEGIVNIRGTVLPLVNLYRRFGLKEKTFTEGQLIVVDTAGSLVALRVDHVEGILSPEELQIEPVPEVALTAVNREFLKEVAWKGDLLIFVLDLGKILSVQERKKLVEAKGEEQKVYEEKEKLTQQLYVKFYLEGQLWAVPIEYVAEVIKIENIRQIPFTPPEFLGLVNLRGEVLWVVDIRNFLGLPHPSKTFKKALVTRAEGVQVAFPIEEPAVLISIPEDAVLPSLSTLEGVRADLVKGEFVLKGEQQEKKATGAKRQQVVILMDVLKVLRQAKQETKVV